MAEQSVVAEGRYRVEGKLGRGGMGTVYRAVDLRTGQAVALKRMLSEGKKRRSRNAELRFRREFHTLASLRHPRIVRAFDYGNDEQGPFYTMELLEGQDLSEVLQARGPLGAKETCAILRDVASALAAVHARGLIHRDLTPRNVRIVGDHAVLFDFGVLANAGRVAHVAGTVSFVAPEVRNDLPIDGRADLFSLGVLAYVMLTRRRPFDAKDMADLPRAWSEPVVPPSSLVAVPEALEDLVLDLLCLEPLGRPPSAAALIDRLSAAGGLAPAPELAVDPGYLASAALVGRESEVALLGALAREVMTVGQGRAFFVEAESGVGKSRLLTELAIRAKLEGLVVLRVACDRNDGAPFAVVASLVEEAFAEAPEAAARAAAPEAALLGRVLPAVRERFPVRVGAGWDDAEPAELRMGIQSAVERFVRTLASTRPLFLVVDDVHACDEASAAALAGLAVADIAHLLVGVALRTGEPTRAPSAIAALSRLSPRLALGGLDQAGVEALLKSIFGDVVNVSRLARRVLDVTAGSPMHVGEVARQLVETGEIRYATGSWIVPETISERVRVEGLAHAMQRRVAELEPEVRRVGEVLAVAGGEVSLERAIALATAAEADAASDHDASSDVFGALDTLTRAGVLFDLGDRLRFRHASLREALLAGMGSDRLRAIHLRAGETVMRAGVDDDPAREAEAGWHFHRGGDEDRGAAMLERAGHRLFEAQALADCIAPLEAALAWRVRKGAPDATRAELSYRLLAAGWVSSREVGRRHARTAVDLCGGLAGVEHASRWGRLLGRHLGLALGLLWAWVRWLSRRGEARGPTPTHMMSSFGHALTFATAIAYSENRKAEVRAMVERGAPLRAARFHPAYAIWLAPHAMEAMLHGQVEVALASLEAARRLATRRRVNPMTPAERAQADAGMRATKALVLVNQFDGALEEELRAIDAIGLRYYKHTAQTTRIVRHRYRGEEDLARALEAATEATSIQLGSWTTDLQRLLFSVPAYALCHDVDGLKRSIDALGRHIEEGMELGPHLGLARAEMLRERGEHDAAIAAGSAVWETLSPQDMIFRQYIPACLAEVALEAYRYQEAEQWARRGLAAGDTTATRLLLPWLRCERVVGLVQDALGQSADGARRLDDAIAIAEQRDCPVIAGQLHEARARLALAAGDRELFGRHLAACDAWLRPTRNPGLITVVERLAELARGDARGRDVDARRRRPGASSVSSRSRQSGTGASSSSGSDAGPRSAGGDPGAVASEGPTSASDDAPTSVSDEPPPEAGR